MNIRLAAAIACVAGLGAAAPAWAQCSAYTIAAGGTQQYVTTGAFTLVPDSDGALSGGGDDGTYTVALPFPVRFYNGTYTSVRVSNNGYIQFTGNSYLGFDTAPLPTTLVNGAAIFAYWNDLFAYDTPGDGIYTQTSGTAPTRQFIVDWRQDSYDTATSRGAFQVIFTEGSDSFAIVYATANNTLDGEFGTIGVQAAGGVGAIATQFADWVLGSVPPGTSLLVSCVGAAAPVACCAPSGVCSVVQFSACVSPSAAQGSASTCAAISCPVAPANDECSGAIALQLNVAATGSNATATGNGSEGPGGACYGTTPTNFNKAVWYSFTAPANDVYGFTACGTAFDTVLSVFDGSCAAIGSELGCDDDTCDGITPAGSGLASVIAPTALAQGQTYLVRLASWGLDNGSFTITATGTPVATTVVCCRGVTCAVVANAAACSAPAGVGVRVLPATTTSCAGQSAINAGCCYADFNKSGVKDVADIFAFLSAWFANSPFSDVGGDGTGTRD
ncbi:MAG: hypothetical protein K2Q20_02545, partial [Phycisphaerales bacterium]|nr:hypothetical protein [Phycisphaerales bacterium]